MPLVMPIWQSRPNQADNTTWWSGRGATGTSEAAEGCTIWYNHVKSYPVTTEAEQRFALQPTLEVW